jgi:hypothetical protein
LLEFDWYSFSLEQAPCGALTTMSLVLVNFSLKAFEDWAFGINKVDAFILWLNCH